MTEELRELLVEIDVTRLAFVADTSHEETAAHLVHAADLNVRLMDQIDEIIEMNFLAAAE